MFQWNHLPSLFNRPLFESSVLFSMWKFYKPRLYVNPSHFLCQLHQGNCRGKTVLGQSGCAIWLTSLDAFGASCMARGVKNTPANAGDIGDADSIGWVGTIPWRSARQYSYLENPMNRGAGQAAVHGSQSRMWLSDFKFYFQTLRLSNHLFFFSFFGLLKHVSRNFFFGVSRYG